MHTLVIQVLSSVQVFNFGVKDLSFYINKA